MGKKGGDDGAQAAQARADEQARQQRIREGTQHINETFDSQFTPDFFEGRKKAFLDYATPQLEDQYAKAQKDLTFSLARNGALNSSTRGAQEGELTKLYGTNKQQIADQALSSANQAKSDIEGNRAGLVQMLNSTGDVEGASTSAINKATALSQPSVYSPLTSLFGTFTAGLGGQAAQERAQAASGGLYKANVNTGLFGTPGRVTVS